MSLEALMSSPTTPFVHHAGHDLESLLNTILTVCHYTVGPNGQLRKHETAEDSKIKLNHWFVKGDRTDLAIWKMATLEAFNTFIQPSLPEYWQDFAPFLRRLVEATWENKPFIEHPNKATHQKYRIILTDALKHYIKTETAPLAAYASIPPAKRLRPKDDEPDHGSKRQRTGANVSFIPRGNSYHFLHSYNESGVFAPTAVVDDPKSVPC